MIGWVNVEVRVWLKYCVVFRVCVEVVVAVSHSVETLVTLMVL